MVCICAHRVFAVKKVFKTGESEITTLRTFHAYFLLSQNYSVQDRKSILLWVENSIEYTNTIVKKIL